MHAGDATDSLGAQTHTTGEEDDSTYETLNNLGESFPTKALQKEILAHIEETHVRTQRIVEASTQGALAVLEGLEGGLGGLRRRVARDVLDKFLASEAPFLGSGGELVATADVIDRLRKEHASDLQQVRTVGGPFSD